MRYSSTNSLTMPTMGHTSWEPLTSPPLLHHTICRDENAPTHSPATRVALWIVAPATVSPIRWRKRVYEYTVRFTVVLYIWTWCRQWILLANICRQLSTKNPQWWGSTSDTYINVYRKMCIQEEILHGGDQHAKRAHTFTSSTYSGRFGGDCRPPSIMRASIQFPPPSRKSLTTIHFPSGT